jgi:hypothetical protein
MGFQPNDDAWYQLRPLPQTIDLERIITMKRLAIPAEQRGLFIEACHIGIQHCLFDGVPSLPKRDMIEKLSEIGLGDDLTALAYDTARKISNHYMYEQGFVKRAYNGGSSRSINRIR